MLSWLFGKGNPRPPLDAEAMRWCHDRLEWLRDEFGIDRLLDAPVIEPTDAFFPDPYDGSERAVRTMFDRVCGYMDVEPAIVRLSFYDESSRPELVDRIGQLLPGSAGLYMEDAEHFVIQLNRAECAAPMDLIGTIAHELSHLRLLGENRLDPDVFDNELLTDLTAMYLGFGIFLANSPRAWPSQVSFWPDSELRRPEYMSLPMLTYALAFTADLRFDETAGWARHLNAAARSEWAAARAYLRSRPD